MAGAQGGAMDPAAMVDRVMRLARLDTGVFDEVRDRESETVPAIIIVVLATLLSSIGAWLWLTVEFGDGVDHGEVITRVVLLGTIFGVALWLVWALIAQALLGGEVSDRMSVIRCMGYASAPAALMLLMLIPNLTFGIGLAAVAAWVLLTNYALQAAAPRASGMTVVRANLAGFAVWAIVLALLSYEEGWGPGIFIHNWV